MRVMDGPPELYTADKPCPGEGEALKNVPSRTPGQAGQRFVISLWPFADIPLSI